MERGHRDNADNVDNAITPSFFSHRYAATNGAWGWKTPPIGIALNDRFGNTLQCTTNIGVNLRTWQPVSVSIYDYQFFGNSWGK